MDVFVGGRSGGGGGGHEDVRYLRQEHFLVQKMQVVEQTLSLDCSQTALVVTLEAEPAHHIGAQGQLACTAGKSIQKNKVMDASCT
jgi:hypothetical protein